MEFPLNQSDAPFQFVGFFSCSGRNEDEFGGFVW